MLRLQTFGTAFIAGHDGEPLGGAATHRRTIALLALLSAAGSGGLSRDKLISILWPDSDEVRARHSLTQALYSARRALDADDLFIIAGPNIRINPERLASDIQEFDDLIARGDNAAAVALYRGPFLDAAFLTDAGDFERWSAGERERIEQQAAGALVALAEDAERHGRVDEVVRWRRQLAGLSPLDSRIAVDYMRSLAAAGDRAGALRHAQVHATLLRQELDIDAHPDVDALAEQIRNDVARTAVVATPPVSASPAASTVDDVYHVPATVVPMPPARRRWWGGAVAALSVLAIGATLWYRARPEPARPVAPTARVVVAPFRVTGADRSLAYLRDGLVELLSARLADDTASRSVDAGAVLRAARTTGLSTTDDIGFAAAAALARALGAERVVVGSVVGTTARVVVSATMLSARDAHVAGQATVSGPADSLVALIDRLAARLLVAEAGQEETLAHYTTRSLPALKNFLAAQAAYRREDFAAALALYDRAIRADSSFALAALYAAITADALHLTGDFQDAVSVAWSARDDLTDRDRALLVALAGPRYPAPSTGAELAIAWQQLADAAPQSGDAWYLVATRLLEDGGAAGIANARERATAALQRAMALRDAPPRASSLLRMLRSQADSTEKRAATSYRSLSSADLRAIALAGQYEARGLDAARRALEVLRARGGTASERADVALAEHSLALSFGRDADALAAGERLRRALPGSDAWLRLGVLDAVHGGGDSAFAAGAIAALSQGTGAPLARPITSTGALANACVVAQWRLAHNDSTGVTRTIESLRQAPTTRSLAASTSPSACAALLDAWLAVSQGGGDARARLGRVDSLAFTPQVAGDASTYAHLVVARLFIALGDSASARRAIRETPFMSGWPRYARATATLDSLLTSDDSALEDPR